MKNWVAEGVASEVNDFTPQRRNSCKSELKSFLSAKNLNDLHVSVKNSATFEALIPPANPNPQNPKHFYKNDQVSRLLDDLSDPENSVDHGNSLKGIVIWLFAARSVVQSPVRAKALERLLGPI